MTKKRLALLIVIALGYVEIRLLYAHKSMTAQAERLAVLEADHAERIVPALKTQGQRLDDILARLLGLEEDLRGHSKTRVTLPGGGPSGAIFGNQSGKNAAVTVTRRAGGAVAHVATRKIPNPSGAEGTSALPVEYQETALLELGVEGAMRKMIVPCGFEVVARSEAGPVSLDVQIRFDDTPCQGQVSR